MKDAVTGLTVASMTGIPPALRDTILKNTPEDATPMVYFCEIVRKVSQGGKNPHSKERIVIVTKDAVLIYAMDGFIKRRIKLQDVAALLTAGCEEDLFSLEHQENPDKLVTLGTVAIASPTQYDAAFEFVWDPRSRTARVAAGSRRTTPRTGTGSPAVSQRATPTPAGATHTPPDSARSHGSGCPVSPRLNFTASLTAALTAAENSIRTFVRVVNVLSRRLLPPDSPEINLVVSPKASLLSEQMTLKKRKDQRQPVLPPTIDTISSETQRQRSASDGKLQVEQVLSDLLNELAKFKAESWSEFNAVYRDRLTATVAHQAELERLRHIEKRLSTKLQKQTMVNERRTKRLDNEDANARQELMSATTALTKQHESHSQRVDDMRQDIEACEDRIIALGGQQDDDNAIFIRRLEAVEAEFEDKKAQLQQLKNELAAKKDIPTIADLKKEAADLNKAKQMVVDECEGHQAVLKEQKAARGDLKSLQEENKTLEDAVLEHKESLRTAQDHSKQLSLKVSALFAKRNRLAKDATWREEEIQKMEHSLSDAEEVYAEKLKLQEVLELRFSLIDAETTVCEDLTREADIHDSITRSVAELAVINEKVAVNEEVTLQDEIETLEEVLSAHSSPMQSGRRSAGAQLSGRRSQQGTATTPRDFSSPPSGGSRPGGPRSGSRVGAREQHWDANDLSASSSVYRSIVGQSPTQQQSRGSAPMTRRATPGGGPGGASSPSSFRATDTKNASAGYGSPDSRLKYDISYDDDAWVEDALSGSPLSRR